MPVEMSDTQLSNRKETQIPAPPPAMARRRPSEALRSNKTINHEPESLPNNSSSGSRGAAGQHRLEHRHPRSLSRIPSQAPNSPNPSGTAWMGPLPGPPLPPSRPSMPLSPLPTKRQLEKKPPLACLFCRGRKIACGPPVPGSTNKTCKSVSIQFQIYSYFCTHILTVNAKDAHFHVNTRRKVDEGCGRRSYWIPLKLSTKMLRQLHRLLMPTKCPWTSVAYFEMGLRLLPFPLNTCLISQRCFSIFKCT